MTYTNVHEYLYKDLTLVYKLDGNYPVNAYRYEIDQAVQQKTRGAFYFFHSLLSFGESDDSSDVHRSNVRLFLKKFKKSKDVKCITYKDNSKAIGIDILSANKNIIDCLVGLDCHGAIDEKDCSKMQWEMENEAWESWIKRDFKQVIQKKFDADWINPNEQELRKLYNRLKKKSGIHPIFSSGGNVSIKPERLAEHMHKAPAFLKLEYFDAA